ITELERFDEALKTQASNLAQNLASITTREDFTNNLVNTLTEGADKLTLADLNEEGANLLALQTASQLATQSLSLASQQSQGVLQLLG
ncbi:flagellin, partial [Arthrospira platensis SPKY1]|nr:flagellin [Arthrospira platensis SPKY1]